MSGKENAEANAGAELNIKAEDARSVAGLLRYALSLNTTLGLVSPCAAASRRGEPRLALSSRFLQLYPALLHVVLFRMHRSVVNKLRLLDEGEVMQDFASSVPRIYLPKLSEKGYEQHSEVDSAATRRAKWVEKGLLGAS